MTTMKTIIVEIKVDFYSSLISADDMAKLIAEDLKKAGWDTVNRITYRNVDKIQTNAGSNSPGTKGRKSTNTSKRKG